MPKLNMHVWSADRTPLLWDISYTTAFTEKYHGRTPSDRSNHVDGDGFWGRGMNILYLDGHVAWEPQTFGHSKQVFGPYDAQWGGL